MRAAALLLAVLGLGSAVSAPASAQEAAVPIRKVMLPGGGRYFALPVRVGSKTLEAAIDTGSPGLRVLSRALDGTDYRATGETASMTFGSGTTIAGIRAEAELGFGTRHGPVAIEVIDRLACAPSRPDCAEGHLPIAQMGLMGGAKPGQGAPAIIGLSRGDTPVTVPFPALGVRRWMISVPNDVDGGRLVLDPSPASLNGFVSFSPVTKPDGTPIDAIRGCLRNDASGETLCGAIAFDTGAPGISVSSPDRLPAHWPPGTPALLLYQDETGRTRLVQRFRTGDPAHSSRLRFDDHPSGRQTIIHANASPYLCFDVLYTAGHGPIALRPRPSGPADPHASGVE